MGEKRTHYPFQIRKSKKIVQKEISLEIEEHISHMWMFSPKLEKFVASKAG